MTQQSIHASVGNGPSRKLGWLRRISGAGNTFAPSVLVARFIASWLLVEILPPAIWADEPIGNGLSGAALRQHLPTVYSPATTPSYRDARKHMFETIDDLDGDNELVGVYTGTTFRTVSIPDPNFVNCEHTWPQSMFSGHGMKSDLHHLYPTFAVINSTRSNKPFGEIPDDQVDDWCGPGNDRSEQMPDENVDKYSESDSTYFEPRETHKGNVAQSMLYFATIYEARNGEEGWRPWFESQLPTLLQWHELDPADQPERDRTLAIAGVQGNVNPFVLDTTLAERAFTVPSQPSEPIAPEEGDGPASHVTVILALLPNPIGEDEGRERVLLANADDQPAGLDGWVLVDEAGHRFSLAGRTIAPLGTILIELEAGELPLKNGGDTVELLDSQGNVMDRVTYTRTQAETNGFVTFD